MMYPLVRELADDGIPVTVTCRVLKLVRQDYYRWLAVPVTVSELEEAYLSTPSSTPTTTILSSAIASWLTRSETVASRPANGRCGRSAHKTAGGPASARRRPE